MSDKNLTEIFKKTKTFTLYADCEQYADKAWMWSSAQKVGSQLQM